MSWVQLKIDGPPIPKKRPRVVRGRAYTPARSVEYENRVAQAAIESKVTFLPGEKMFVDMHFELSGSAYALTDLDNLIKSALDGLQRGGMFDDRDVVTIMANKRKVEKGFECTRMNITALPRTPLPTNRPDD